MKTRVGQGVAENKLDLRQGGKQGGKAYTQTRLSQGKTGKKRIKLPERTRERKSNTRGPCREKEELRRRRDQESRGEKEMRSNYL